MVLVAITTHKREPQMLERAIKSVVNQTYRDWHLLIVDDSPADYELRNEVKHMADEWCSRDERITYMQHDKNYGVSRARNNALRFAVDNNFKFIAYLDDDDEWLPEKLEKQIQCFSTCSEDVAMVIGGFRMDGSTSDAIPPQIIKNKSLFELAYLCGPTSSPMIRTQCLHAAGGFNEEMKAREDWELWIRIVFLYKVKFIHELLWLYHMQSGPHISTNITNEITAREFIINKYMNYLESNHTEYWSMLLKLAEIYSWTQYSKQAFFTWYQAVKLKPFKIIKNLKILALIVRSVFREFLKKKNPKLFYCLKHKVKGEK